MTHKAGSVNKSKNPRRRSTPLKTIALAATFAVLFGTFQANAYPLHKGEYAFWPEMPEAARVLADMKGKNDLDTAARQHAALNLLIALVNVDADGKGQTPWPACEQELNHAYHQALPDGDGHRAEMQAESLQLQVDQSFVQPFLKRYFSEAAVREIEPMVSVFEANAKTKAELAAAWARREAASARGKAAEANQDAVPASPQHPTEAQEAAQIGLTPSQVEIFNTSVRTYLALCLIFSILWVARILRASKSIRTTSEYPPQFEGPWKSLKIHSFTGYVRGSATRSNTITTVSQSSVSSTISVTDSFRLVDPRNKQEQNFQLRNWDVPLWEDQLVSVAWAIRLHRNEGPIFILVNHTTGEHFLKNNVVMEIAKRPSLFWTLSFFICIFIPPVWLLAIIWGILIGIQTKRFMSSGVQPLVKALNQKAKKFS